MLQALLRYLDTKSDIQRDEMIYFIWDTFDVMVSESAVSRFLRRMSWSRKLVYFIIFMANCQLFKISRSNELRTKDGLQNETKSSGTCGSSSLQGGKQIN